MALVACHNRPAGLNEPQPGARKWKMRQPPGHPDLVLARAIRDGVIDQAAAHLIGDTRLEGQPLRIAARTQGLSVAAGRRHRRRAERRLIGYLGHRSLVGLYDQRAADRPRQA